MGRQMTGGQSMGDLIARRELLRLAIMHATELSRFLKSRLSDVTDAQDIMQELYLAVLRVPYLQAIHHPKAYLYTIAANLAHQHRERKKAQPMHVTLDEVPIEVHTAQPPHEVTVPEAECALAERAARLAQCLAELSPKIQAAILWHYRDGYTCDEIGEKLSVARHRVKKYLVKGLTHCRSAPILLELTRG